MRKILFLPFALLSISLGFGGPSLAMPTVAVPDFKNEVANIPWWSASVSSQLADVLANELVAAGGLQVVERQNLKTVLSEQELAELGITRPEQGAESGQMTRAQYLVLGRVNAYEAGVEQKTKTRTSSFLGFGGGKGAAEAKAYVAIELRVVDTTTGEIVAARTVEGTATDTAQVEKKGGSLAPLAGIIGQATDAQGLGAAVLGVVGSYNYSGGESETRKVPVAKAIRAALIEGSNYVSCVLVSKGRCDQDSRRKSTLDILDLE